LKIDRLTIQILNGALGIHPIKMDIQNLQREIREYLCNLAFNDLSIIRWSLVEERMYGEDGIDYLDALLAYRDAELATEVASKEYRSFLVKHAEKHWEQEEYLYNVVRDHKRETNRTHQVLMDLILASDSYKQMVVAQATNPLEDLPDYG
jgi:hypothetical protein